MEISSFREFAKEHYADETLVRDALKTAIEEL
jgi:hypothetical protein